MSDSGNQEKRKKEKKLQIYFKSLKSLAQISTFLNKSK